MQSILTLGPTLTTIFSVMLTALSKKCATFSKSSSVRPLWDNYYRKIKKDSKHNLKHTHRVCQNMTTTLHK